MESIITFIVILLIGSLFGGKKNKKQTEQKQAKPFTAQPNEEPSPFKKLKEMSQEMYRELQQEMQQESEPERKQPTVVRQAEVVIPPTPDAVTRTKARSKQPVRKTRNQSTSTPRRTRSQARQKKEIVVTVNKTEDLLPKTEEDIMKGIIFSEIFGPPKSKR